MSRPHFNVNNKPNRHRTIPIKCKYRISLNCPTRISHSNGIKRVSMIPATPKTSIHLPMKMKVILHVFNYRKVSVTIIHRIRCNVPVPLATIVQISHKKPHERLARQRLPKSFQWNACRTIRMMRIVRLCSGIMISTMNIGWISNEKNAWWWRIGFEVCSN